jgi:hypothetical protein
VHDIAGHSAETVIRSAAANPVQAQYPVSK